MLKMKWILKGLCVLALIVSMPVFAAENGCENPENDVIAAELALCSTHAYNINELANPTGADKELMKDVVAMKTTVITQQMYRQYEQMESMLRRLNTQLEKAVLNMKLKKAGASADDDGGSSSSSSSWRSDNKNIHISRARDCMEEVVDEQILKCYQNNLNAIADVSENGNNVTSELRKQLAQDYKRLSDMSFGAPKSCTVTDKCKDEKTMKKRDDFGDCLNEARTCLQNQNRAYQQMMLQYSKK